MTTTDQPAAAQSQADQSTPRRIKNRRGQGRVTGHNQRARARSVYADRSQRARAWRYEF
jgi:hypothetical protein